MAAPSAPVTLQSLLEAETPAEFQVQLFAELTAAGFKVTAWQSGGGALTLLMLDEQIYSALSQIIATIAQSGFVTLAPGNTAVWTPNTQFISGQFCVANGNLYKCIATGITAPSGTGPSGTGLSITDNAVTWMWWSSIQGASGDWLGLLAANRFQLPRQQPQTTVLFTTVTCASSVQTQTLGAGQVTIQAVGSSNTVLQYTNIDPVPLGPSLVTTAVRFQATSPGSIYNLGDNYNGWVLVTSLAGVSVTNPAVLAPTGDGTSIYSAGSDVESDSLLTAQCIGRWSTLGSGATAATYALWAQRFSNGVVTRVAVSPNNGSGTVTLTIASSTPGGNPGPAVVAAVQASITPLLPECVALNTQAAPVIQIQLNGQVRCVSGADPAGGTPPGAANIAAQAAITQYSSLLPPGGEALGAETGTGNAYGVALERITGLIEGIPGVDNVLATNGSPPGPGWFTITSQPPGVLQASVDPVTGDLVLYPGSLPIFSYSYSTLPFLQVS